MFGEDFGSAEYMVVMHSKDTTLNILKLKDTGLSLHPGVWRNPRNHCEGGRS